MEALSGGARVQSQLRLQLMEIAVDIYERTRVKDGATSPSFFQFFSFSC